MKTIRKTTTGMYTMTLVEMMLDLMQQEIFLETLALALCFFCLSRLYAGKAILYNIKAYIEEDHIH